MLDEWVIFIIFFSEIYVFFCTRMVALCSVGQIRGLLLKIVCKVFTMAAMLGSLTRSQICHLCLNLYSATDCVVAIVRVVVLQMKRANGGTIFSSKSVYLYFFSTDSVVLIMRNVGISILA